MSLLHRACVLLVLLSVLCVVSVHGWNAQPPCASNSNYTVTGHIGDSTYTTATYILPGVLRLTPENITHSQYVYTIGINIASGGNPPSGGVTILLSLWQQSSSNPNQYNLLNSTGNFALSFSEAAGPGSGNIALQGSVLVAPGIYYVGIAVNVAGIIIDGNPSVKGPAIPYTWGNTLPSSFIAGPFSNQSYQAQVSGCLYPYTPPGRVVGDPLFTGFKGQVYQVHGIPDAVFNLLSSKSVQLNSRFVFLRSGDAMSAGQQREAQYQSRVNSILQKGTKAQQPLPDTAAWSHTGTYIGETGLMLGNHKLYFRPGRFLKGIQVITINGVHVNMSRLATPLSLLKDGGYTVTIQSFHTITVITPLLSFDLVNSDGFFNIDNAQILSPTPLNTNTLEGILGQSADPTRYFPKYAPTKNAPQNEKDDFQLHQQLDYLIVGEEGLFSTDFPANKYEGTEE